MRYPIPKWSNCYCRYKSKNCLTIFFLHRYVSLYFIRVKFQSSKLLLYTKFEYSTCKIIPRSKISPESSLKLDVVCALFFFLLYLYHEMEKYGMREKFRITLWVSLPCCLCHSEDQAVNQNFQKMEELKITEKNKKTDRQTCRKRLSISDRAKWNLCSTSGHSRNLRGCKWIATCGNIGKW